MAIFKSTRDILNQALSWSGELTDVGPNPPPSEYREKTLEFLNDCYLELLSGSNEFNIEMGQPWPWARAELPGVLILKPLVQVTVALTNGSSAATLSVAQATSMKGRLLRISGQPDPFWISAHTAAGTAMTLDGAWTGESGSYTAELHMLRYELTQNVLRLVSPFRVFREQGTMVWTNESTGEILMDEIPAMMRAHPLYALRTGIPNRFAIRSESQDTNKITVQFNASVLEETRVEYEYIPYPEDLEDETTSVPIVPAKHRRGLAYGAAYKLCVEKNDDRRVEFEKKYVMFLESVSKEYSKQKVNANPNKARLVPRMDQVSRYRLRRTVGD